MDEQQYAVYEKYKRHLTLRYIFALSIIASVILSSYLYVSHHFEFNKDYAAIINISGKQRMYSQKIAFLATHLAAYPQAEDKEQTLNDLKQKLSALNQSHQYLLDQAITQNIPELKALYDSPPVDINRKLKEYTQKVEAFINQYERLGTKKAPIPPPITFTEGEELLEAFDAAVTQYQNSARQTLKNFEFVELAAVVLGFLVLLAEAFFIFRPMVRAAAEKLSEAQASAHTANQKAEEKDRILRNIVENMPAIVFGKDVKDGFKISLINKEGAAFFGIRAEDMLGKTDFELWANEEAQSFRKMDLDVIHNEHVLDIPCETVTTPQGARLVHTRKVPIYDESGEAIMLLGISQDITERKKNEEELEKHRQNLEEMVEDRTEKLKKAIEKAEELNRLKSEFVATMSHEIRTPMNGILGMAELIQGAKPSSQIEGYAQTIINSGEALQQIIDDILDFSKIEAGKLEFDPMSVNMLDIVDDLAKLYSVKARDKAIELAVRYVPGSEQFVFADPLRIRQVLGNLISNAIKFTDKGHAVITVEEIKNKTLPADKVELKFSITDTGIGISKEMQARVFEKFSQADNSTTRKYGGTGLGLSICKSLVELMGGKIGVHSREGHGSTFWFTILFTRNHVETQSPPKPEILKDVRILIVDDLPVIRQLVTEQLSSAGMRVSGAESGAQAMEMLQRAHEEKDPYKIAIIDYLMPGMNGEMLASLINDHEHLRGTCLIMLTAAGNPLADDHFAEKGFSALIAKPVSSLALIDSVSVVWKKFLEGYTKVLIRLDTHAYGRDLCEDHVRKLSGAKVLVAEDNLVNQIFIKEILEEMEIQYTIVSNGHEALEKVQQEEFKLIIMDCLMPEMDGWEASRQIRGLIETRKIKPVPICALTANAMKGDREKCLQAGMDDYLAKPVRKKELQDKVYTLIMKKEPETGVGSGSNDSSNNDNNVLDLAAVENARSILKGKYDEMVELYIENTLERIEEIQKGLNDHNPEALIRPAHTLKSTSRQMGAHKLSEKAKHIELIAKAIHNQTGDETQSLEDIVTSLEEIKTILSETQRAFERLAA